MPSGKNWLFFAYVNLGFIAGIFSMYYFATLKSIKDNWAVYRCNPMYMPLSSNIQEDFTYCVQNMQTNMMGYLLQPLTYIVANIGTMGSELSGSINDVREMFNKIRNFASSIIENIFGVFLNIIVEFQKITIGIVDLIGKIVGTMTVLMYLMDGTMKTMQSVWNGPPGQMTRNLGKCFFPETLVKLKNGEIKQMQDLNLGDVLENGSIVKATMKIDNSNDSEAIYVIKGKGVNNSDIFVTGSHLILDNRGNFIEVKDYSESIAKPELKQEWFSCIITDNHFIGIGDEIFWDWEDYIIKLRL